MSQRNLHEQVDMGVVVSQYPIDKYKASANKKDLVSILTPNPIIIKSQYHDNIGFRFHSLPIGTSKGLMINIHYAFLIAVWNTDAAGTQIIDNTYRLQVLVVADRGYERLRNKFNLVGDLSQHLLQVTCEDEKYQSLIYEQAGKSPHLLDNALYQKMQSDINFVWQYVPLVCAADIDEVTFLEYWNENAGKEQPSVIEQDARNFASSNVQLGAAQGVNAQALPPQQNAAIGAGAPQMNAPINPAPINPAPINQPANQGAPINQPTNQGVPANQAGPNQSGVIQEPSTNARDFGGAGNVQPDNLGQQQGGPQDAVIVEDNTNAGGKAPQMNAPANQGAPQMNAPINQPANQGAPQMNAPANQGAPQMNAPINQPANQGGPQMNAPINQPAAQGGPANIANAPINQPAAQGDQSQEFFNQGGDFNFEEKAPPTQ